MPFRGENKIWSKAEYFAQSKNRHEERRLSLNIKHLHMQRFQVRMRHQWDVTDLYKETKATCTTTGYFEKKYIQGPVVNWAEMSRRSVSDIMYKGRSTHSSSIVRAKTAPPEKQNPREDPPVDSHVLWDKRQYEVSKLLQRETGEREPNVMTCDAQMNNDKKKERAIVIQSERCQEHRINLDPQGKLYSQNFPLTAERMQEINNFYIKRLNQKTDVVNMLMLKIGEKNQPKTLWHKVSNRRVCESRNGDSFKIPEVSGLIRAKIPEHQSAEELENETRRKVPCNLRSHKEGQECKELERICEPVKTESSNRECVCPSKSRSQLVMSSTGMSSRESRYSLTSGNSSKYSGQKNIDNTHKYFTEKSERKMCRNLDHKYPLTVSQYTDGPRSVCNNSEFYGQDLVQERTNSLERMEQISCISFTGELKASSKWRKARLAIPVTRFIRAVEAGMPTKAFSPAAQDIKVNPSKAWIQKEKAAMLRHAIGQDGKLEVERHYMKRLQGKVQEFINDTETFCKEEHGKTIQLNV